MNQDLKCYQWTNSLFPNQQRISFDEARSLIHRCWLFYKPDEQPPIMMSAHDNDRAAGGRFVIKLPIWALTKAITLHEIAHSLGCDQYGEVINEGFLDHGPSFMKTVIDLYAMFTEAQRGQMRALAIEYDITVAD